MFAAVSFQADDKESVMERPLREPPQNVGDNVFFFYIIHSPFLCSFCTPFIPPVPFVTIYFFNPTIPPLILPPSTTMSVYSAFTQAAQWAALPYTGNCWGVGPNSILDCRHVMFPHSGGSEAGILLRCGLGVVF